MSHAINIRPDHATSGTMQNRRKRVLLLALGGAAALIFSIAAVIVQVTKHVEQFSAETSATAYLEILADTQHFYSRDIVGPAKKNGVSVRRDFADHPNSIPFPATFMHGLTESLSQHHHSKSFRFFSLYPFYDRPRSGPQDSFEEDALAFFHDNPDKNTFSRVEDIAGEPFLRNAVALRMGESCVICHNAHAESPKKDWMVGDLRGVQAVSEPISFFSAWSVSQGGAWLFILCGISVALVIAVVVAVILVAWRHIDLSDAHARIETLVWQDTICDLANRRAFVAMIEAELDKPDVSPFAIFMMDLVNFKAINDVHGHIGGDDVLRIVSNRLTELPYRDITVARIGGDEFALLQRRTENPDAIEKLAKSIVKVIGEPICLNGRPVHTGTSVGIALAPKHGQTARELLDNADMAMYRAKATTGCQWSYFSGSLRENALRAERLAEEIREGISSGQFVVYYQPQFCLNDGRVFGLEALVRWAHPAEGLLLPDDFLPIAEERGLILALSEVVVKQSIQDILRWRGSNLTVPRIAINIHQDQISDINHIRWLERCYAEALVDPSQLTLEITEGCILGRGTQHVPNLLRQWRDRGYGVSLDDFGTGFASLSHLKNLPVNEFKIDRSFIHDLVDNPADRAIVDGLIKLSKELGTTLIAEGVETLEQAIHLRMMGSRYAQGYLFAPPLPPKQTDLLIEQRGAAGEEIRQVRAA